MKKEVISFIILLFFANLFSVTACDGVDINSATVDELDNLIGIGPVYAQRIIDSRPFSSLDALINVKGIGNITLTKIKDQGLACVDGKENSKKTTKPESEKNEDNLDEENIEKNKKKLEIKNMTEKNVGNKRVITLNQPKVIQLNIPENKTTEIKFTEEVVYESKNEKIRKYSIYAFCIFLILIIIMLLIRK